MAKNNLIQDVLAEATNRRSLLKKFGLASAAAGAAVATGALPLKAQMAGPAPEDVVQFALNLEYLEAEFYSVANTGMTLEQSGVDISGSGTPGATTTQFGAVPFTNNVLYTADVAKLIGADETNHVKLLRMALMSGKVTPIAKPAINLDALAPLGASLETEAGFLLLSRIFEDIGVTAYAGGAGFLQNSPYLGAAARILAVEAEHVANIRLQVARLGLQSPQLDGADVLPPPAGTNFFSTNVANGLIATRTPGQVLYLAYGNQANVTKGGFFPNGVNGAINMSSDAATDANLA